MFGHVHHVNVGLAKEDCKIDTNRSPQVPCSIIGSEADLPDSNYYYNL